MRYYLNTYLVLFCVCNLFFACQKDDNVDNQNSNLSAYNYSQGIWYFSEDCVGEYSELISDLIPNTVIVEGVENGQLVFSILDTINLDAYISENGDISIPNQTIFSIDTVIVIPITIPIQVYGNGNIESADFGNMTLTYSLGILGSINCNVNLFRYPLEY